MYIKTSKIKLSKLKNILIKIHWVCKNQFGIDMQRFLWAIVRMPAYLINWFKFRKIYSGKVSFMPCLHDIKEEGGAAASEYFWQDILVARSVYNNQPERHVDVGSRVDGFVAHVASFRKIEVFDVRPITSEVQGIIFRQADLMDLGSIGAYVHGDGYCDSLSCLHAIEHFGLGRYGDKIDPSGYKKGIANLAKILKSNGTLYLSTPIGQERVEFNANWVFDPCVLVSFARSCGLVLQDLTICAPGNSPKNIPIDKDTLEKLSSCRYKLGIFVFKKE